MAEPKQDTVDFACEAWAHQWVSLFARDPRKASEYLGRLNCTLGEVRVMADGAASGTVVTQSFPEVFLGEGLVISCLSKWMTERDREMLFRHYADRWYVTRPAKGGHGGIEAIRLRYPVKQEVMAHRMKISLSSYHKRRDILKSFVRCALASDKSVCTHESDCRLAS